MASLGEFAHRIRLRGRDVEKGVNRIVRTVALVVDREVVLGTPVDTGRARSNWIASLGSAVTDVRDPYSPGNKLGIGESNNAEAAMSQAKTIISTRKSGTDVYISNNVDYIGLLNDGSSAQAPAGFVQSAIKRGVNVVVQAEVLRGGD
jgi:hypothetical protein